MEIFTKENWKSSFFLFSPDKSKKNSNSSIFLMNEINFSFKKVKNKNKINFIEIIEYIWEVGYEKLKLISYFCDIINNFILENEKNDAFYEMLKKSIEKLKTSDNLAILCLAFEIKILSCYWIISNLDFYIFENKKIELKDSNKNLFSKKFWWILPPGFSDLENEKNDLVFISNLELKIINFLQKFSFEDISKLDLDFWILSNLIDLFKSIIKQNLQKKMKINLSFQDKNKIAIL